ncbi:MAG: FMN-binding protein [Streptosporangiales bacterium]|nr:FMN-binding protein [Streptosporangiales bacterium]
MMIRAVLALGGTAAGLAALLSFKTHPAAEASAAPMAPAPGGSASAAPMKGASAGKAGASKPGTANAAAHTVTGSAVSTQFGPMQVAVTMAGKKITGVKVLQKTDDGAESQQIDANAIPKLTSETLAAQSARIDAVSGASYTSSGYKQSLQSALDKAM